MLVGMNIAGLIEKGKAYLGRIPGDVLVVAVILLSASGSFGLGYLAGKDAGAREGFQVESLPMEASLPAAAIAAPSVAGKGVEVAPAPVMNAGGQYVASKNGTKYYLPWCGGAARIKEENKVWFASKEEAEAKGYEPAANCQGL